MAIASGRAKTSVTTEWSTVNSAGMTGFTLAGSPPNAPTASRIAARSTRTGMPLVSCRKTRAGANDTASPVPAPDANRWIDSAVTDSPSS